MEFGSTISESFGYAKEAVWGKWARWILLLISSIIFPLILGYMVRIYRGVKPAPELEKWGEMFIDGLKLFVITLIYAIPVIIVLILSLMPLVTEVMAQAPATMMTDGTKFTPYMTATMGSAIATFLLGLVVLVILAIIIAIIEYIGVIRFARTGRMGEAFNFSAIFEQIGKIGWGGYILALIVLAILGIIYAVIASILMMIPIIGWLLYLFTLPVWIIFASRYLVHVYDSAVPAPAAP